MAIHIRVLSDHVTMPCAARPRLMRRGFALSLHLRLKLQASPPNPSSSTLVTIRLILSLKSLLSSHLKALRLKTRGSPKHCRPIPRVHASPKYPEIPVVPCSTRRIRPLASRASVWTISPLVKDLTTHRLPQHAFLYVPLFFLFRLGPPALHFTVSLLP